MDRGYRRSNLRRSSSSGLMSDSASRKHRPDYLLIILATILSVVGLIVVYSISPALAVTKNVSQNYFVTKQLIAIIMGVVAFVIFSNISLNKIKKMTVPLAFLSVVGVVAVEVFSKGTSRWIQIGGLSFQVAELIKLAIIVWLAVFLVNRINNNDVDDFKKSLRPLLILLALIGIIVAKIESDLGSAGVLIAIMGVMTFVAGLPFKKIAIGVIIVSLLVGIAIVSTPYRRARVATFLNPTSDCQDAGYQVCQALIAVGSGGIVGRGLGNSVQAYGYLPEAQNDSIFAILAEKFGFFGGSFVIALYIALFSRLKRIIERTADTFSRLFVVGVLAWLSTQTIINIGAMLGLLPLKGITLPFISYGGTSILFVMAALGVVAHISRYTSFEPIRNINNFGASNENSAMRQRVGRTYNTASGSSR